MILSYLLVLAYVNIIKKSKNLYIPSIIKLYCSIFRDKKRRGYEE